MDILGYFFVMAVVGNFSFFSPINVGISKL